MRILHLEDNHWLAASVRGIIEDRSLGEVTWASTYDQAWNLVIHGEHFDVVIADQQVGDLLGRKGLDLLKAIEGPRKILFTASRVEVPEDVTYIDKMYPDRLMGLLAEINDG